MQLTDTDRARIRDAVTRAEAATDPQLTAEYKHRQEQQ